MSRSKYYQFNFFRYDKTMKFRNPIVTEVIFLPRHSHTWRCRRPRSTMALLVTSLILIALVYILLA